MEIENDGALQTPVSADEIAQFLASAHEAADADQSIAATELCRKVVEADPGNAEAWVLLAKVGGWDSKMYTFDIDFAVDSAKHALGLIPEGERYETASDIYLARKQQIGKVLESEMMMPSYTAAKQLNDTMFEWLRLLKEIPYLNSGLLEGEISLVDNLCLRSKMGIMPADRLVYTAYASLNGKVSYGEIFREQLQSRLSEELERSAEVAKQAVELADGRLSAYRAQVEGGGLPSQVRRAWLEDDLATLREARQKVLGLSNRGTYVQQIEELERQRAAMKPYKVFKIRTLDEQTQKVRDKLAEIDGQMEAALEPLDSRINEIESLLAGIVSQ